LKLKPWQTLITAVCLVIAPAARGLLSRFPTRFTSPSRYSQLCHRSASDFSFPSGVAGALSFQRNRVLDAVALGLLKVGQGLAAAAGGAAWRSVRGQRARDWVRQPKTPPASRTARTGAPAAGNWPAGAGRTLPTEAILAARKPHPQVHWQAFGSGAEPGTSFGGGSAFEGCRSNRIAIRS
jgi:hypothetical protein